MKKILIGLSAVAIVVATVPLFAAFEAHVINVTARIENALRVHPEGTNFGTVFPQEYLVRALTIGTSDSFCKIDQRRVLSIDYKIKQKPKPRPEYVAQVGVDAARQWCHDNYPPVPYDPQDPAWIAYLANCYPSMCAYLSKQPKYPESGDTGILAYHDPFDPSSVAYGTINKDTDDSDEWVIDLDVPCFKGHCDQSWTHPGWELPPQLESQTFGCDLWVEVTGIY